MSAPAFVRALSAALLSPSLAFAGACIPYTEAPQHLGKTVCVTGTVLKVHETGSGTRYLEFCPKYRDCPLTVVSFDRDRKDVGDLSNLAGRQIELRGRIRSYHGHPEIVLNHERQLHGGSEKFVPARALTRRDGSHAWYMGGHGTRSGRR